MRTLSVNLDHVATIRQTRNTRYPALATTFGVCEMAGADGITLHLRQDRRHIQDRDVEMAVECSLLPVTLEMAAQPAMADFACRIRPRKITLVPERSEELTTEGGMDLVRASSTISSIIKQITDAGIELCLFLEPDPEQIRIAKVLGAQAVELHTGRYADLGEKGLAVEMQKELERLRAASYTGTELGLVVNAGHGLHYQNVTALAEMPDIHEFSIGHAIISRAVFTGLELAVREMVELVKVF